MSEAMTLHANALVIGEAGILITGVSGAGKSSLAIGLIHSAAQNGRFARLVADDRTRLMARGNRLVASAPREIFGLVELRMLGPTPAPSLEKCVIALVIDLLSGTISRFPEEIERETVILGCKLARLALPERISTEVALPLVLAALPQ